MVQVSAPRVFFHPLRSSPWQVDSPEQLGSAREILLAMENAVGVVSILVTGPDKVWEISEKDNVTGESSMWGAVLGGGFIRWKCVVKDVTLVFSGYTFYKKNPEFFFSHLELVPGRSMFFFFSVLDP